jgi:hypothetical protein
MKNDTLELLHEAKNIVADPDTFTQGAFARDKQGNTVNPESDYATAFCGWGAIQRVAFKDDIDPTLAQARLVIASDEIFGMLPQAVNDELGREAVLRMYHLAINDEAWGDVNTDEQTENLMERNLVEVGA